VLAREASSGGSCKVSIFLSSEFLMRGTILARPPLHACRYKIPSTPRRSSVLPPCCAARDDTPVVSADVAAILFAIFT
jgi:hypothetical protein